MALSKPEVQELFELIAELRQTCLDDDVGILWDFEDRIKNAMHILWQEVKPNDPNEEE